MLQKLEALLRACLILALHESESDESFRRLLRRDRETMGRLLRHMTDRVDLPQDFADTFDRLLEKRNLFVHKLFLQNWFDLKTRNGLNLVDAFTSELLAHGSIAVRVFIGYAIAKTEEGIPEIPECEKMVFDQIILRIFSQAIPDFGGKSPDNYLNEFIETVQNDYVPRIKNKN